MSVGTGCQVLSNALAAGLFPPRSLMPGRLQFQSNQISCILHKSVILYAGFTFSGSTGVTMDSDVQSFPTFC